METVQTESSFSQKIRHSFELVKFSHTIFALPFALAGYFVAGRGRFEWRSLLWVVVSVLGARTAAMAFNRLADHRIDALNPRTQARHLPQGLLTRSFVLALTVLSSIVFLFAASQINRLCLMLAPPCLALLFIYSLAKRFTHYTQIFLGIALGMAPIGAAIAATGAWNWDALWLGGAVLFWVAGFDLLYALQDLEFDRAHGLKSLSVRLGIRESFRISSLFHLIFLFLLAAYGFRTGLGKFYWIGLCLVAGLLVWEHLILKEDLKKIQASFFTANGLLSLLFLFFTLLDTLSSR